jgi:hypothetical protein
LILWWGIKAPPTLKENKMSETKSIKYQYEGDKGKVFNVPKSEKLPNELAAHIYRNCGECNNKTKKLDILGGHCSVKGSLNVKNGKCTNKK